MAQKRINDLQLRSDFDETCNFPSDDLVQTWRVTGQQVKDFIEAEASFDVNNIEDASITDAKTSFTKPTIQKFTSGSGTYTTPAGVKFLKVTVVGGGGGGGGSGAGGGAGNPGGNSTFGSSLLTATSGTGGANFSSAGGGVGGSPNVNAPAVALKTLGGGYGSAGMASASMGGSGGTNPLGGCGMSSGVNASTNSGAGGGGGGSGGTAVATGGGGGAGGYLEAIILNPSATYAYAVGASGSGGAIGTSGSAGGAGGSGVIIVEEYYQ